MVAFLIGEGMKMMYICIYKERLCKTYFNAFEFVS